MAVRKSLKTNGELDVARANNILDLKLKELHVKVKLLNGMRVHARRQTRIVRGLRASNNHLARREDERRIVMGNQEDVQDIEMIEEEEEEEEDIDDMFAVGTTEKKVKKVKKVVVSNFVHVN